MKSRWSEGAWVRLGWLIITLALGIGLILLSWANYRSARAATHALYLGEGRLLTDGIFRDYFHTSEAGPNQEDLERLLTERKDDGLRWVALIDGQGSVLRQAGSPAAGPRKITPIEGGGPGPTIVHAGSRIRMTFPEHPSPGREAGPGPTAGASSRDAAGQAAVPPRPPKRPGIVLEFEPLIANRLMERSARSLVSGIAVAALMLVAVTFFWRLSRRYEQARRHLEDERRLSLMGEMSAVLAHEIRNPLASLKGNAQLLSEHLAPETGDRRKADLVVSEATRLENLTTDLLEFARSGPLDLQPNRPSEWIQSCADEVEEGGFDLDLAGAPEEWLFDARRLRGALTNLLRNARQASPPGTRPRVKAGVRDRKLIVTVIDSGEGLPRGQEDRIFDPFFTTRVSGTGLGLTAAKRIIEMHGGSLKAANQAEGGAVFEIVLPDEKGGA